MNESLYSVRVYTYREQLLQMVGSRETVVEAALRVILDSAPPWQAGPRGGFNSPMFSVDVQKIK